MARLDKTLKDDNAPRYLEGQLLVAMPLMSDPRFARSVIYMCAHSEEGAMGIIINQPSEQISFPDLLDRLEIAPPGIAPEPISLADAPYLPIHVGGPVETGRGFVLHSPDYFAEDSTLTIDGDFCLTATVEILRAIATHEGPRQAILALGYAGWSPGQLEQEIHANGWLHCPADSDLIFETDAQRMYESALAKIGVDPSHLVAEAGHA